MPQPTTARKTVRRKGTRRVVYGEKISFRLQEKLDAWVQTKGKEFGLSISDTIRNLLLKQMLEEESEIKRMRDLHQLHVDANTLVG